MVSSLRKIFLGRTVYTAKPTSLGLRHSSVVVVVCCFILYLHISLGFCLLKDLFFFFQDTENDRYIFMSSMLGLLAEYGIFPRVANASSLTNNVKVLITQDQSSFLIRKYFMCLSRSNCLQSMRYLIISEELKDPACFSCISASNSSLTCRLCGSVVSYEFLLLFLVR